MRQLAAILSVSGRLLIANRLTEIRKFFSFSPKVDFVHLLTTVLFLVGGRGPISWMGLMLQHASHSWTPRDSRTPGPVDPGTSGITPVIHLPRKDTTHFLFIRLQWRNTGQKNGCHVFGYNSAESEPIWIKSEQCAPNVGALTDFGRDPHSSKFEREAKFSLVTRITHDFTDFPSDKFLRHLNTTMSIGQAVKTFGTEFRKFYYKELFFQKNAEIAKNQVLRLQAAITQQWL